MEMTSNIYGRKMKLYGGTIDASYNLANAYTSYQNAVFLRYIDVGLIKKTSLLDLPTQFLFDTDGEFVSGTASVLDSYVPNWQQMPILYLSDDYSGSVSTSAYLGLFTNAISLNSYGYDIYFITADDIDGVQAFQNNYNAEYGFSKTDGSSLSCHFINYTRMGSSTQPKYTWVCWYFINNNTSSLTGQGYINILMVTDNMKNSVYLNGVNTNLTFRGLDSFNENYVPDNDPYSDPDDPDDDSDTGGGDGDHDGSSDPVDIPDLPTLSATDTGFVTIYNPTLTQLQGLANYMWSDSFDLDTFKKLWADPMTCILGMSIIPVTIPGGTIQVVSVGNIETTVSMTKASTQYVEVDCGSVTLNEYWGAYIDYSPYTKIELFLPYCGCHSISTDDVMGKTVTVKYHVDILSGSCVAYVKCGDSVLYTFQGNCACSVPITGNDWTNVVNGAINIASSIGTMVATGGATAPMAATSIASTAVNNIKPNIEKSGAIGSMGGLLASQKPYFIITRPRQAKPANQNLFMGYPSYITSNIGSLSGYTEMEVTHVGGFSATDTELAEIDSLLKEGVFL